MVAPKQEPEYCELSQEQVKMEITEELDLKPNVKDFPIIHDKSVVKDSSKEIEKILIFGENTSTPSDTPTDKTTSKEQNKPEKNVSYQASLEEEMAMLERELMIDNEKKKRKEVNSI